MKFVPGRRRDVNGPASESARDGAGSRFGVGESKGLGRAVEGEKLPQECGKHLWIALAVGEEIEAGFPVNKTVGEVEGARAVVVGVDGSERGEFGLARKIVGGEKFVQECEP